MNIHASKQNRALKDVAHISILSGLLLILSGCNFFDDDDDPMMMVEPPPPPVNYSYEVSVTNLTNAQPLSPVALLLHSSDSPWTIGSPASAALETLAEGGDNSQLTAESWVEASSSGAGVLMPGASETLTVTKMDTAPSLFSAVTMLVNTNDAFTGIAAMDLQNMMVGDSQTLLLAAYDAGTEANSEMDGTIPGPADGGEGFNAARDDVDFVARHAGIVGQDDGLTNSVLSGEHRFDNPVLQLKITRTE